MRAILAFPLLCVYCAVVSIVGVVVCLCRPFNPNNSRLFANLFSAGGRKLMGIDVKIEGEHWLKRDKPCVYIANHQANMDLFVIGGVVPERTVSVGKSSLKYIPFFGQLFWLAGNVLIDRGNKSKAKEAMESSTEALTRKNTSIWVFPEGTRNKGENMLPFKKGAFITAIKAGVPIIPICVDSYVSRFREKAGQCKEAAIRVLPPINTDDLTLSDVPRLMAHCQKIMKQSIDDLDRRYLPSPQVS